jgi:hypothetical protein
VREADLIVTGMTPGKAISAMLLYLKNRLEDWDYFPVQG